LSSSLIQDSIPLQKLKENIRRATVGTVGKPSGFSKLLEESVILQISKGAAISTVQSGFQSLSTLFPKTYFSLAARLSFGISSPNCLLSVPNPVRTPNTLFATLRIFERWEASPIFDTVPCGNQVVLRVGSPSFRFFMSSESRFCFDCQLFDY